MIILLFILFFPASGVRRWASGLQDCKTAGQQDFKTRQFLYVYILLFFYYITASIFYGHYQERYRLPLMVLFIIPVLGYFIAASGRKQFGNKVSLIIKGGVIVLFLVIWSFQAKKAILNKERLQRAIELVEVKGK
jgi:hypothetical protein